MSSRSLNKVLLIGNLTRDPELRYTPQGTAVCSFGLATNRVWTTDTNEKREETEFHRIVAWNKLAELCAQLLFKGRKVYIEGRLQTRAWTAQDGTQRQATEVIAEEMMVLDSRMQEAGSVKSAEEGPVVKAAASSATTKEPTVESGTDEEKTKTEKGDETGLVTDDLADVDIPAEELPNESEVKKAKKAQAEEKSNDAVKDTDIPF